MTNETSTAGMNSITRTISVGFSRSRRVVAALALTAGLSLGVAGFAVPQADASVGWCMRCYSDSSQTTVSSVDQATSSSVGWCMRCYTDGSATSVSDIGRVAAQMYTVPHNVYASTR